jgi:hypothetical protein
MSWGAQSRSEEGTCSLTHSKPSTYEYDGDNNETKQVNLSSPEVINR